VQYDGNHGNRIPYGMTQ